MNANKKVLILATLIGVALLFGGMWKNAAVNASQSYKPKPTFTPEVLANGLYRFTDTEAGYYFDYPPNVVYLSYGKDKGEKYNHVDIDFTKIGGAQGMILIVKPNPRKLSAEEFLLEWHSEKTKKSSQSSFSKEEIGKFFSIGGVSAIQTELIAKEPPSSYSFHVIFTQGDKIFITGPAYGVMRASAVTPEAEALFAQILNTFTFIP
jgi:hypothetical protein